MPVEIDTFEVEAADIEVPAGRGSRRIGTSQPVICLSNCRMTASGPFWLVCPYAAAPSRKEKETDDGSCRWVPLVGSWGDDAD